MTYEDYMALGLLPDSTPDQQQQIGRDVLSEAHRLQIALNMLMADGGRDGLYPHGNFYDANGNNHVGVLPNLTSERVFAGHIADTAVPPAPMPEDVMGVGDTAADLLGFGAPEVAEPEFDPFAHPSGITMDPERPFFDEPMGAGAATPPDFMRHGDVNPQVYGFDDSTIAGLADALGPDISSVSRLGGPFAGYSNDALTARLRELVRRV